jgi:hypothetical protein
MRHETPLLTGRGATATFAHQRELAHRTTLLPYSDMPETGRFLFEQTSEATFPISEPQ